MNQELMNRELGKIEMVVDYVPAKECKNKEVWYTCYKCGKCGRKFENGFMVNDGGTTADDEDWEVME